MATQKTFDRRVQMPGGSQGSGFAYRSVDIGTYWSNRENGQIVRRESPCDIKSFTITRDYGCYLAHGQNAANNNGPGSYVNTWVPSSSVAYSRAYAEFKKLVDRPSSEMLLNIVEAHKALEMIAARAFQLRNLISSLRRGRLGDAWNYMTLNPDSSLLQEKGGRRRDSRFTSGKARERNDDRSRNRRQLVKDIGSVILEVRYGWAPLMQDIASAIEVLGKKYEPVSVRASKAYRGKRSASYDVNKYVYSFEERVTIKGTFTITNPNLVLANELGLVNPLSVAWEAVPFSFLADWFLPVGDYLRSLTDYVGVTFTDASITGRVMAWGAIPEYAYDKRTNVFKVFNPACDVYNKKITRTVGISSLPKPPLVWGRGLTPGRAINAVALVLGLVKPKVVRDIRHGEL